MVLSRSGAYVADKVLSSMAAHAHDPISGRTQPRSSRSAGGGSSRSGRAYPSARSRESRGSRRRARTPDPLLYRIAHDNSDPLHNHTNIGAMGVYKRDSRPSTSSDNIEMQRQQQLKARGWGRETPPTVRSNTTGSVRSLFEEFDEDHDGVLNHEEVDHLVHAHPQLTDYVQDHDTGVTFDEFRHEVDHNGRPLNTGIHPLGKGFAAKGLGSGDPNRLRGAIQSKTHHGRDGHHMSPQYKTRTELFDDRRRSNLPDPTFDVDGDGVVSQEDFRSSNKFDFNKDGELQEDERHDLRKELVKQTVDRYMSLPHRMKQDEVMPLIDSMTEDLDATVDHPAFLLKLKQLNNASSVSRTFDSKGVHRSIQPYPNLAKAPGTRNDDHNYGCAFDCVAACALVFVQAANVCLFASHVDWFRF
jgi:Ca2+-binding EF-hand superfamily protein